MSPGVCWILIGIAVAAILLWDHHKYAPSAEDRRAIEDTQPIPQVPTFKPIIGLPAPRPIAVDEIAELERWFNAPAAPEPEWLA